MKTYENIHGWFNFKDYYDKIINFYIKKNQKDVVLVEMGVWLGKSIIYLATIAKERRLNCKIFAIDNFTGGENPNPQGEIQPTKKLANEKYNGNYYDVYNQNLIDCGVRDMIIDIKKPSLNAVKEFKNESIDFIFIDGDHHYKSVSKDLKLWYPKMKNDGIFSGHDIKHNGVMRALNEFNNINNTEHKRISKTCWYISNYEL